MRDGLHAVAQGCIILPHELAIYALLTRRRIRNRLAMKRPSLLARHSV